jgi:hypothetical protein
MNAANPNIRYGSTSPGEGWVYAGKTRNPTSPPKAGWQTIDYWKKAPAPAPAPAAAAPPPPPPAPAPAPAAAPAPARSTPAAPPPPASQSAADGFASAIGAMQSQFQVSLAQQASQFADMQRAQEERMTALQQQMKEAQAQAAAQAASAAAANRPTTAGVKAATGTAGSAMQIARSGVRGTFNRAGMRIQGLNV